MTSGQQITHAWRQLPPDSSNGHFHTTPKMISKNTEYLPRIDHLRFIAAALVAAYHFGSTSIQLGGKNPLLIAINERYDGASLYMIFSGLILTSFALANKFVTSNLQSIDA